MWSYPTPAVRGPASPKSGNASQSWHVTAFFTTTTTIPPVIIPTSLPLTTSPAPPHCHLHSPRIRWRQPNSMRPPCHTRCRWTQRQPQWKRQWTRPQTPPLPLSRDVGDARDDMDHGRAKTARAGWWEDSEGDDDTGNAPMTQVSTPPSPHLPFADHEPTEGSCHITNNVNNNNNNNGDNNNNNNGDNNNNNNGDNNNNNNGDDNNGDNGDNDNNNNNNNGDNGDNGNNNDNDNDNDNDDDNDDDDRAPRPNPWQDDEPQPPHHPHQWEGNTRCNTGRRGHPHRLDLWCVRLHLPRHPPTKCLAPNDRLLMPSTAKNKAPATSSTTMMALSPPFLLLSLPFHPPLPSPHLFTYMYYLS